VHVVWWATLCAATVSLFGSSFMLVTILIYGKSKGLSQLIIYLALADWGWALSVVISHIILLINSSIYTYKVCVFFRLLFQFFGGSTVFWTTCISFFLYRCVFSATYNSPNATPLRNTEDTILFFFFHVLSWGVPLIFCITLISTKNIIQEEQLLLCFPEEAPHFYMWFLPIIICFVSSVIVYTRLMFKLKSSMSWKFILKGLREQTLSLPFRISLYLLVFFVCWGLDITQYLVITFYTKDTHNTAIFTLVVAYNVLLMSQGTLDVLVYGLANKEMRKSYTERLGFCFALLFLSPFLVIPCMFKAVRRPLQNLNNNRYSYQQINYSSVV